MRPPGVIEKEGKKEADDALCEATIFQLRKYLFF
jgi:hypothetical protein